MFPRRDTLKILLSSYKLYIHHMDKVTSIRFIKGTDFDCNRRFIMSTWSIGICIPPSSVLGNKSFLSDTAIISGGMPQWKLGHSFRLPFEFLRIFCSVGLLDPPLISARDIINWSTKVNELMSLPIIYLKMTCYKWEQPESPSFGYDDTYVFEMLNMWLAWNCWSSLPGTELCTWSRPARNSMPFGPW